MDKYIAVEGVQFEIYEGGTLNPNRVVQVSSQCSPSSFVTSGNKKAYAGTLLVEVKGFSSILIGNWVPASGSTTTPSGVAIPGSITTSCTKAKAKEGLFFLEGDQAAAVTIYGQMTTPSGTVSTTTVISIKIKSAGQNVVKAT